jgi:fructose-1,6-bisphosphatase/sedoheptulose 1,7-bisphosphatase-like protein
MTDRGSGWRRSACRRGDLCGGRAEKNWPTGELAPGRSIVFAACGVTDGNLLKGVRFFGDGTRTQSIVMTHTPARVRFIDTVHLENKLDVKVRFR